MVSAQVKKYFVAIVVLTVEWSDPSTKNSSTAESSGRGARSLHVAGVSAPSLQHKTNDLPGTRQVFAYAAPSWLARVFCKLAPRAGLEPATS